MDLDYDYISGKFAEFVEKNYYAEFLEKARKGEKFLNIDFSLLSEFDPKIAEELLEEPEEILKIFESALTTFDVEQDVRRTAVRVKNLPETQNIVIRNIRSKDIGKFLQIVGVVRQKSDVRPQVTSSKYECPACGTIISILQLDSKMREPTKCGCGRKGKFKLISKELCDAQSITLEEAPEDLEGGAQPKRLKLFLKNDLVSPISEKRTNPGTKILVTGIVKEVPIVLRSGAYSTTFELMFEVNYVDTILEEFSDIVITKEDEEEIRELSKDPKIYDKMIEAIAPSIYGHERIKEALVYQLMGGVRKKTEDGVTTRGDMHILLIGDPGAAKSQMLKRISTVAPKAVYVSGKGASGAGLTASVVKDEFLQGWSLEAGALILANKGMCMIDELDKMSREDRSAMHEALEQQTVTISKANIQATLRAETTVLAAANPKFGRFDPNDTIARQINLPPALINRFDLIFPIKDIPDEKKDDRLASFILKKHQTTKVEERDISTELLRKYIAYVKRNIKPVLSDAAIEEIKKYYLMMRSKGGGDSGRSTIPITARQLEGLVRVSEAVAKVRLAKKISRKDAKRAIDLIDYGIRQIAFDEETGTIDIDRIAIGTPTSERGKMSKVREIITELENKIGKIIPIEEVVKLAEERGIDEADVESIVEKLKRLGDIYEPKRGSISKL